jgi:hypothetical protein
MYKKELEGLKAKKMEGNMHESIVTQVANGGRDKTLHKTVNFPVGTNFTPSRRKNVNSSECSPHTKFQYINVLDIHKIEEEEDELKSI